MKKLILAILTIALAVSCGNEIDTPKGIPGNTNANIGLSKYAKRIEVPAIDEDEMFWAYTTTYKGKEHVTYSLSHNPERKHSRWTAFAFYTETSEKNWDRKNWNNTEWGGDPWDYAPEISKDSQLDSRRGIRSTYGLSGYDRGHLVASEDRVYSQEANRHTFYSVNMSPMYSKFNQEGGWHNCENLVRNWGKGTNKGDTLYVVKGGTIKEGEYRTVGKCPTIPNHYFMALLLLKNGAYRSIGLLFEHVNAPGQTEVCSIDYLESFTGIDFFCNLPDIVENNVEKHCSPASWTGLKNYTLIEE